MLKLWVIHNKSRGIKIYYYLRHSPNILWRWLTTVRLFMVTVFRSLVGCHYVSMISNYSHLTTGQHIMVVTRCVAPEWLVRSPGPRYHQRMSALHTQHSRYSLPAPGPGSSHQASPGLWGQVSERARRGDIMGANTFLTFAFLHLF